MRLETEAIGRAIFAPKELRKVRLEERWFFDRTNWEILSTVKQHEFTDATDLAAKVRFEHPLTKATPDLIESLRIEGVGVLNLKEKSKQLQRRYQQEQVETAARKYAEYPNAKNLEAMKEQIQVMDRLEEPEDTGDIKAASERILHQLETENDPGIKTYNCLDSVFGGGLAGGILMTVGARPGVGKTAYGVNLAIQAMQRQKLLADFFTLEMSQEAMLKRFLSRMSEINSYRLRNPYKDLDEKEKQLITAKIFEILDSQLKIYDSSFKLEEIEAKIRERHEKANGQPYIAFVDYLGLIEVKDQRQPRHVQIGEITRVMKKLTNELKIPIVLFSQLNREIENRQHKIPTLADLRESGSIEQDSNAVLLLHEDEETQETIVNVAKNREGSTGEIRYQFFKTKMYFQERGFKE